MTSANAAFAPLIRYLPANEAGRDFVVGDLHGCWVMLDRLLARAGFDPAVDRLFSVGDLIDRGPDSMGCLALLQEPWFHAVRGNHEAMLLDFAWDTLHYGSPLPTGRLHDFLLNGGGWLRQQTATNEGDLPVTAVEALAAVRRLPFLIVAGEGARRFHIVHTDLYTAGKPDEVLRDDDIDALADAWRPTDFATLHPADYPHFAKRWLWSRIIMDRLDTQPLPATRAGLSPTYCGHTIAPQIRRALSHICLDTGAFIAANSGPEAEAFGLTLLEVATQQVYRAGPPPPAPIGPGAAERYQRFLA